jgi:peroxiredoxin
MSLMQNKSLLCCLVFTAVSSTAQHKLESPLQIQNSNTFVLEGTLKGLPIMPEKVYLIYDSTNAQPADSAVVKNGRYAFKGKISDPALVYISPKLLNSMNSKDAGVLGTSEHVAKVFLDKGKLTASSSQTMDNVTVTGSAVHKDYVTAVKQDNAMWKDTVVGVAKLFTESKNKAYFDMLFMSGRQMESTFRAGHWNFMKKHPASPVTAFLLCRDLKMGTNPSGYVDSLATIYDRLPEHLKASPAGMKAAVLLGTELKSALGHKVPDFTQPDNNGNPVSLSSFKGKYVMIAFWKTTDQGFYSGYLPYAKKAYSDYKDKGLALITVSLDENKDTWLQTLDQAGIPGTHLSDGKGPANEVAQLFGVTASAYPLNNVLIAPNGRIVAKNLSGTALSDMMTSIFN